MLSDAPWDFGALVVVLLLNRTLVPSLKRPVAFWCFQALTVGTAAWFVVFGIEGLGRVPVAKWVVAGLLVFHAVQNVVIRRGGRKI